MSPIDPAIRPLLPRFIERKHEELTEMEAALERGDFELVARIAHRMAGSGATYGFDAITELGRELEKHAKGDPTPEGCRVIVAQMQAALEAGPA